MVAVLPYILMCYGIIVSQKFSEIFLAAVVSHQSFNKTLTTAMYYA